MDMSGHVLLKSERWKCIRLDVRSVGQLEWPNDFDAIPDARTTMGAQLAAAHMHLELMFVLQPATVEATWKRASKPVILQVARELEGITRRPPLPP